jgi:hypothetical protein
MRIWGLVLTGALLFAMPLQASAAAYRGIGPFYSLNDVKAIFPQAEVEMMKPAWAQPHQSLARLTGGGIDGSIIICLIDYRDYYRLSDVDKKIKPYLGINYATDTNNALVVEWVRHVPSSALPVQLFKNMHGAGYKKGNRKDDYSPTLTWEAKGVEVTLTPDGKSALYIDYSFTVAEYAKRAGELMQHPKPATYIPESQTEGDDDNTTYSTGDETTPIPKMSTGQLAGFPAEPDESPSIGDVTKKLVDDDGEYKWVRCEWDGAAWRIKEH